MGRSRPAERGHLRPHLHSPSGGMVRRRSRGDSRDSRATSCRSPRKVVWSESSGEHVGFSPRLETSQSRGSVLLLPRNHSYGQESICTRSGVYPEGQDTYPREGLDLQCPGRSSSTRRIGSVEEGRRKIWLSPARPSLFGPPRGSPSEEGECEAFFKQKEKGEAKGQRDARESQMEDRGNSTGSGVQKANQAGKGQAEEKEFFEQVVERFRDSELWKQRGLAGRAQASKNCSEASGVLVQEGFERSSHHTLPKHRGRGLVGRGVSSILPPNPATKGREQSNLKRNDDPLLSPGHLAGWAHPHSCGPSCPAFEVVRVAGQRQSGRISSPTRDHPKGDEQSRWTRGSPLCSAGVQERGKVAEATERGRQMESWGKGQPSNKSRSAERKIRKRRSRQRRQGSSLQGDRSERLTRAPGGVPPGRIGLSSSSLGPELGALDEGSGALRRDGPPASHVGRSELPGTRPRRSGIIADLVQEGFKFLQSLPTDHVGRTRGLSKEGVFPLPSPEEVGSSKCETERLWVEGIVRSLNWMNVGSFNLGEGKPSREQRKLLETIREGLPLVELWRNSNLGDIDPKKLWSQKMINSYGEEVHVARSLRWENVSASLPKEGLAGVVKAVEVCEDGVKDFILHPENWLKPPKDRVWMRPPKIMVPKDSWDEVTEGLISRGVCGVMAMEDIFQVDGKPILGGIFGVPKDEIGEDGVEILRLIMDLRPINANFLGLGGDWGSLPMISQLFQLEPQPHENIVVSSEDIRAMFYIIGLPPARFPFLGFGKVVNPKFNPEGDTRPHVLHSKVLPMGYLNSVSVAQHLHRRIALRAMESSQLISAKNEIRRDMELPRVQDAFRIYLDNFDQLSKESKRILNSNTPSLTEFLRKEYLKLKVPRNEKKAVSMARQAEVQGAWVDGERGICCAKPSKVGKYLWALLDLLGRREVTQKQMQMLTGGLVYLFGFRRPLMAILNHVWEFIVQLENDKVMRPIPHKVKEELLASFFLSATAFIDFRLPANPIATCSDASESGGGLCQSIGMTPYGEQASEALVRGEFPESGIQGGVLGIGAFDGIGALRVALDGLGAPISGYISIESNDAARRVMESAFPSTKFFGDITKLTKDDVKVWAAEFPNTKLIVLGGGPPCQGVSGLNPTRLGAVHDPRSNLVQCFANLRQWVKEVFHWCPVRVLMESVASMNDADRSIYSKAVGILPYKVDSKGISLCHRPRLWWFDWEVSAQPGVDIYPPTSTKSWDWGEIVLEGEVNPKNFLKPGCQLAGGSDHKLPTFTTAQPKPRPGFMPVGLRQCSDLDRQAWESDRFRFPPYVYQFKHGIMHKTQGWRMPSIEEKEAIMFFPIGYTYHCSSKAVRKHSISDWEDERMTLIGNSWHVGVVAFFFRSCSHQRVSSLTETWLLCLKNSGLEVLRAWADSFSGLASRSGNPSRQRNVIPRESSSW